MANEQASAAPTASKGRIVAFAACCYLLAQFLYRAFTVAHEYPIRTEQALEISLDALMLVAVITIRKQVPAWLFWLALVAGLCLFGFRLTSDSAWWTGHLMYSIH